MLSLPWKNPVGAVEISGREISFLALMISFPVIGLDQFLRTEPSKFFGPPYTQLQHWLTASLMALPLFAAGIWAGDRISCLAGVGTRRRTDAPKRALVIAMLTALALAPVWFVVNKSDNPVTARPLVFPHAQDSGDVYWVAPWVILTLVCVCLVPAAVWTAHSITGGITRLGIAWLSPRGVAAATRAVVLMALLAAALVLSWLLHQAATHAYASQVYYASAPPAALRRFHALFTGARLARPAPAQHVAAAPFAFVYQAAHALQDGLAGQAAGLPVTVIVLLRGARGLGGQTQHQPADT